MKIEMGKQYKTRDGRDVRVLCIDGPDKNYPVVAAVNNGDGDDYWTPEDFTEDGTYVVDDPGSVNDLIEVKPEITEYVNIYSDGTHYGYPTKQRADSSADSDRIACIKITYCEGEGL